MDGKGRYSDNIFVERLWRTVKYEEVHQKAYANVLEAQRGLEDYFWLYNGPSLHQAMGCRTAAKVFHGAHKGRMCSTSSGADLLAGAPKLSLNFTLTLSN